ncbi:MAG: hypothetical protein ACI8WP_000281, partial [Flavobacteriaceae bacterium]
PIAPSKISIRSLAISSILFINYFLNKYTYLGETA